jgi:hypothetical protein
MEVPLFSISFTVTLGPEAQLAASAKSARVNPNSTTLFVAFMFFSLKKYLKPR